MAAQWLRLWHEMPNDPKWRTIARHSKKPVSLVTSTFLHMLVNASQSSTRGTLKNWSNEDVASALDVEEGDIQAIYDAMQGRVLQGDTLLGWEIRQFGNDTEGSRGGRTSTERSRDSRAKKKAEKEQHCNGMQRVATECNGPDTDTDTDTESKSSSSATVASDDSGSTTLPPLPAESNQTKRIGLVCRLLRSKGVNCNPTQFAGKYAGLELRSDDDFLLAVDTLQLRGEKSIGIGLVAAVLDDIEEGRHNRPVTPAPRRAPVNTLPTSYGESGRL